MTRFLKKSDCPFDRTGSTSLEVHVTPSSVVQNMWVEYPTTHPYFAKMLREYVGDRRSGLLFHSSTGAQLLQSNTLSDSLHPILDYMAHERGGFNIFRRFRLTHLVKSDCPDAVKHFWSGHAPRHVSERYTKLTQDRDFRLMWAEKIGLGFELPGARIGQLGQLVKFRKVG
jgi:hypothetical protein